ncbi:MAG: hypothetical protein ACI3U1_10555 [Peptococcaceae bacterium]
MHDVIYTFNGKDITMNMCIQIHAVIKVIQKQLQITFYEALALFYRSETYKIMQNTENALWAESAEYIADQYFAEKNKES